METRYRSYLEKARSVIKTLDPKHNNNTEVVALRAQIIEKARLIRKLEAESKEKGSVFLNTTVWHIKYAHTHFAPNHQTISHGISHKENFLLEMKNIILCER